MIVKTHQFFKLSHNFKNHLFIIYVGPKNSVCGMTQAKLRSILNKSTPSTTIIHPYNSIPIKVGRTFFFAALLFMATECCQLDGDKAIQLQIISTDDEDVSGKRS